MVYIQDWAQVGPKDTGKLHEELAPTIMVPAPAALPSYSLHTSMALRRSFLQ